MVNLLEYWSSCQISLLETFGNFMEFLVGQRQFDRGYYSGLIPKPEWRHFWGGFRYYHLINQLLLHGWFGGSSGIMFWPIQLGEFHAALLKGTGHGGQEMHGFSPLEALLASADGLPLSSQHLRCLWGFGSHMSHEKHPGSLTFHSIACLIGILIDLIVVYEIIPI